MQKSFKEKIEAAGLSYKKELTIIIVVNILLIIFAILLYILFKQIILAGVCILGLLIFNFLYCTRYSSIIKQINKNHVDELISILSYFEIFISNNNNVYTSLKGLLPYCSAFMEDAINTLLFQIDNDKSVQPFVNFSSKFDNKIIESLMISIYQMIDNGENTKQFQEFDNLFSTVSRDFHSNIIDEQKSSLETFNSLPLFGAGAVVILLTLCILSVVGEMVNVV